MSDSKTDNGGAGGAGKHVASEALLACERCGRVPDMHELMVMRLPKPGEPRLCMVCVYESRGVSRDVAERTNAVFTAGAQAIMDGADRTWDAILVCTGAKGGGCERTIR